MAQTSNPSGLSPQGPSLQPAYEKARAELQRMDPETVAWREPRPASPVYGSTGWVLPFVGMNLARALVEATRCSTRLEHRVAGNRTLACESRSPASASLRRPSRCPARGACRLL